MTYILYKGSLASDVEKSKRIIGEYKTFTEMKEGIKKHFLESFHKMHAGCLIEETRNIFIFYEWDIIE